MDLFAKKPDAERHDIFTEAASRRDVQPIVIEKDFWVCWTLKRLFTDPKIAPHLTFKGGTSLSKAYGLIERFSEDIDLTISREAPFLADGKDPMGEGLSGKERNRRIDMLRQNAQKFVNEIILKSLAASIEKDLGQKDGWQILIDPNDPDKQTIIFQYPAATVTAAGYIKPAIKLEFGARGGTEPQNEISITSYVAQDFSKLFQQPACCVATLSVTRSFWEKVTILHALYHGSRMRDRMSRHYYDTFMMDQRGVTEEALADIPLLVQVVHNKTMFFRDAKASYDSANIGNLRLVPQNDTLQDIRSDYKAMDEMFMGKFPSFDEIIEGLAALEARINGA